MSMTLFMVLLIGKITKCNAFESQAIVGKCASHFQWKPFISLYQPEVNAIRGPMSKHWKSTRVKMSSPIIAGTFENQVDIWLDMRSVIPGTKANTALADLYAAVTEHVKDKSILTSVKNPISGLVFHQDAMPPDADEIDVPKLVVTKENAILSHATQDRVGTLAKLSDLEEQGLTLPSFPHPNGWLILDRTRSEAEWKHQNEVFDLLVPLVQEKKASIMIKVEESSQLAECFQKLWNIQEGPPLLLFGENGQSEVQGLHEVGNKKANNAVLISGDPLLWEIGMIYLSTSS